VSLDGVEVTKLGTPGNFGNIGRYPVHFHLAGYAKSFKEYLPEPPKKDGTYRRELRLINSSLWRSFMRFATVHGTMEAEIRNNVGSGYSHVWDHVFHGRRERGIFARAGIFLREKTKALAFSRMGAGISRRTGRKP